MAIDMYAFSSTIVRVKASHITIVFKKMTRIVEGHLGCDDKTISI